MWRTPEELVEIGFARARVVMMNEAHDGDMRCVRTRKIGRRVLPIAHRAGVRHLAMEALWPELAAAANRTRQVPEVAGPLYPAQPDFRDLMQDALDLGWTLIPYEPVLRVGEMRGSALARMNRRELVQAQNLIAALAELPRDAQMLVWCGGDHHRKTPHKVTRPRGEWVLMGCHFAQLSGMPHFAIDQTVTIWLSLERRRLLDRYLPILEGAGGTAGLLVEESHVLDASTTALWAGKGVDAVILSVENTME